MKILLINNYFTDYGGAEIYISTIANELKKNHHEVFFFATDKQPFLEKDYKYAGFFPKVSGYNSLSVLKLIMSGIKPFYNFEAERKMELYLREIKPDIVHLNCIFYELSPSVINACKKFNIPVVMTLHSPHLMCPSVKMMIKSETYCHKELCVKGNPVYCAINRCRDKSLIKSIGLAAEYFFRKLHRLYDRIDRFICPSNAVYNLALKSGINGEKLIKVDNCIDETYFEADAEYTNKGYFLYAGRLSDAKGVHYLLKAMSKLPDIKLHIVGTGPEENGLKTQAENLGLSNVEFLGFKTGEELLDEYKGCIAAILPCNWFEIFGLVTVEAFASGKPVIASNVGGIPEIIDDGINGITFEPGNVDELTEAIRKLNDNPDLVIEMGKNARNKAEKLYNPQIHYEKLINVYLEVCN